MSIVDIGSVRFGGWQGIIAAGERVLLAVKTNPLRITLRTPHPSSGVEVVENQILRGAGVHVVVSPTAVAITLDGSVPLVMAHVAHDDSELVICRVELRPLGMAIWDDAEGLHIGSSVVARSELMTSGGAAAFQLAPPREQGAPSESQGQA